MLITTPIYYVNDKPHLGHAYTTIAADVLARFQRLDGEGVYFLTGTDEHGQKVEKAAANAGIDPQAFTDGVSQNFRDMVKLLGCSNDDFIRTTEGRHKKAVQTLWEMLEARGAIYLGKYAGWYAVRDEAYYGEDELKDGPNGKKIAPSGAECEWVEEESYFFKLTAYGDKLLDYYEKHPDFIMPESRRNEVISFVKTGLRDLSVSRTTFRWGIPVPGNDKHVIYVWLDALVNYISALGWPNASAPLFRQFWPGAIHLVGKDILRFHTVYWPAFLMAAGLPVPFRVFAHGWWTAEGQKMSKSVGNVIVPGEIIEKYGLDAVRYFVLRELPFGQDGDFSHEAIVNRINRDLANDLGNLAQRVLSFIAKNGGAVTPRMGAKTEADEAMLAMAHGLLDKVRAEIKVQSFHRALDAIWAVIAEANRYVDSAAPWSLRKTDPVRMNTVLAVLVEVIRSVALVVQPFMPTSMEKMLDQLGIPAENRRFADFGEAGMLEPGLALPAPAGVFPRFTDEAASNAG